LRLDEMRRQIAIKRQQLCRHQKRYDHLEAARDRLERQLAALQEEAYFIA
jgi:cell division protein FtsB